VAWIILLLGWGLRNLERNTVSFQNMHGTLEGRIRYQCVGLWLHETRSAAAAGTLSLVRGGHLD